MLACIGLRKYIAAYVCVYMYVEGSLSRPKGFQSRRCVVSHPTRVRYKIYKGKMKNRRSKLEICKCTKRNYHNSLFN